MDGFTVAWVLWALGFVAIEGWALFRKEDGDTLSEHIRALAGTSGGPGGRFIKVRRLLLLGGLAWLAVHLLTPGFV